MDGLAVTLLVIMLPGIIAAVISDKLVSHDKWTSFKFTLYAFVLGVGSYCLLQVIIWVCNVFKYILVASIYGSDAIQFDLYILSTWRVVGDEAPFITSWELISASLLSVIVALTATWVINRKVLNQIARATGASNKYGDENLYSYFLNATGTDWVYIRDIENNLTYQGRVIAFSETDSMQELVLEDVSVFSYNESEPLYEVPSIYLIKEMGKFIIEVIPFEYLGETSNV